MQDDHICREDPGPASPAGSAGRVVERLAEAECLRLGSVVFPTTQDTFTDEIEGEPEHAIRINPIRIWGHRIR